MKGENWPSDPLRVVAVPKYGLHSATNYGGLQGVDRNGRGLVRDQWRSCQEPEVECDQENHPDPIRNESIKSDPLTKADYGGCEDAESKRR